MLPVRSLVLAVGLFALLNGIAGVADMQYQPAALATPISGSAHPQIIVLAASYGEKGLHLPALPPDTAIWWCDGTAISTWERLSLPDTRQIVLALSPATYRDPGVFTDLPLRRLYGISDLPWLLALGEGHAASEVLASRLLPLYRMRQGIRRVALSASDAAPALPRQHDGLPGPVAAPWDSWKSSAIEREALRRMARPGLVVAEWPLAKHLDVADAVRDFRDEMAADAERWGFTFLPLPEDEEYTLVDAIHPSEEEGRRWSAWLTRSLP